MLHYVVPVIVALNLCVACSPADPKLGHREQAATFPAEEDWIPLRQAGDGIGDVGTDGGQNDREIVGDATSPALFTFNDGTDFFLRIRVDDDPTGSGMAIVSPFGWGIVLDTDDDLSAYEFLIIVDGTGPDTIRFAENTDKGTTGDPSDTAEVEHFSEAADDGVDGNIVISPADTSFGGDQDFFLDFAIPLVQLTNQGIDLNAGVQVVGATSNNGQSLTLDMAGCVTQGGNADPCTLSDGASDPFTLNGCGNAVLQDGEGCDDGNLVDNDGCNSSCEVEDGAACNEDANGTTGNGSCASGICDTSGGGAGTCEAANQCGNGVLEAGEGCDDGDQIDTNNGCEANCLISGGTACNDDPSGATGDLSCGSGVCDLGGGAPGLCTDLLPDGSACTNNSQCDNTCIDNLCAPVANNGGNCDSGDDNDCTTGNICDLTTDTCLLVDDENCAQNADCVNTCIAGTCAPEAGNGGACDAADNADCSAPNLCDGNTNTCLLPDAEVCTDNAECVNTCIGGSCSPQGGNGDTCDNGDDDDCIGASGCDPNTNTCIALLPDGQACTDNAECINTCIANTCAPPANTTETCDLGDDDDCAGANLCDNGTCLLPDGETCAANADCVNTCIATSCAPVAGAGGNCDNADDADCTGALVCGNGDTCQVPDGELDFDQDGIPDGIDLDDDNDGIPDDLEETDDIDGDGIPNHHDLDSDNDGIADAYESGYQCLDVNRDAICDGPFGSNGLADDVESRPDSGATGPLLNTDDDSAPDFLDLDSDGDGDSDFAEAGFDPGLDSNNDGQVDGQLDADADGIHDATDADTGATGFPLVDISNPALDGDGDGIPDPYDADDAGPGAGDSNGDGTDDNEQCPDPPGWPACPDSDSDGTPDYSEEPIDTDGDGIRDGLDLDDDNDGILDSVEGTEDFDLDGIPNSQDLDSDGDGIFDAEESGHSLPDEDKDGVIECEGGFGDNGFCDHNETPVDTDGDGDFDFLDLDSDNDTISDEDEAQPSPDSPPDTDGDGTPDYQDTDADDDGIPDSNEAGDSDIGTPPVDTDGDGEPDYRDSDSDNDTIPDEDESTSDADGDGIPDFRDDDANGDGINDALVVEGGGCNSSDGTGPLPSALLFLLLLGLLPRKAARSTVLRIGIVTALFVLIATPTLTVAQNAPQDFSLERFRLSLDREGILDVESAKVPARGEWEISAFVGYQDDPLILRNQGSDDRIGALVSHRVAGSLLFAFGLLDQLQVGLALPLVFSQGADSLDQVNQGELSSFGIGDLRIVPKFALLNPSEHGLSVAIMPSFTLPTAGSDNYMGNDGASFQPELALGWSNNGLRLGANLAYQTRRKQELANLQVEDEWRLRVGAAKSVADALEIDASFSMSTLGKEPFAEGQSSAAELLAGLSHYLKSRWVVFAAGGPGLANGFGTPDWRVFAGVRVGRSKAKTDDATMPQDRDGDGLYDDEDDCPEQAETFNDFEDEDGCPDELAPIDTDGDGLLDSQDQCPNEAEDADEYADEDGCPDLDNDQDGVLDTNDECPIEPGEPRNNGCPLPDRDGDTVADRVDNCPDEPGKPEFQGCNTKPLVLLTDTSLEILDRVFFKTNKAKILPQSFGLLDNVAAVLNAHEEIALVEIEGHTDSRGADRKNLSLSQRRANSVLRYLVNKGVDKSRLKAIGYGETRPIKSNDTDEGRSANRRVEFKIIGDAEGIEQQESGPGSESMDSAQ